MKFSDRAVTLNPRFATATAGKSASITFGELLKRFRADQDPGRSPKTALKRRGQDRLFLEIIGANTRIDQIDRKICRRFQSIMKRLPANWSKLGIRASEVLDLSENAFPPMSPLTANSYLSVFSSVFAFAESEHLIDRSPAKDLCIAGDGIPASERRQSFTNDELNTIFSSPKYPAHGARHWLPLVALFSGCRLNELAQLRCGDIEKINEVVVLMIRGARLKNEFAKRPIPIHPELIKLGLLDHAAKWRAARGNDAALPASTTGYASDPFNKNFIRFLHKIGITPGKGMHSFRHNFRDAIREANISIECAKALMGHARSETHDAYGSGLKITTLAKAMETIAYSGLMLPPICSPRRRQ